jgi:type II secretory pathway pseudopilin PulG
MKHKGFSLVEIMVGLGVIIALAAATFPTASAFLSLGRHSGVKTDVGAISAAISQYVFEVGTYPPNLAALTQTVGQYGPWLNVSS